MGTSWIRGSREVSVIPDGKGRSTTLRGKNGGPVIKQEVVKVLTPRR